MKVTPIGYFKEKLPQFIKLAKKEPVFITRNGKIEAVIEALSDDDVEDSLLEHSPRFRSMLEKAARKPGRMSLESYRQSRKI